MTAQEPNPFRCPQSPSSNSLATLLLTPRVRPSKTRLCAKSIPPKSNTPNRPAIPHRSISNTRSTPSRNQTPSPPPAPHTSSPRSLSNTPCRGRPPQLPLPHPIQKSTLPQTQLHKWPSSRSPEIETFGPCATSPLDVPRFWSLHQIVVPVAVLSYSQATERHICINSTASLVIPPSWAAKPAFAAGVSL